jgi:hypothetical protein
MILLVVFILSLLHKVCYSCNSGQYQEIGCIDCPAGTYFNGTAKSKEQCSECPIGMYSSSLGAIICYNCTAGTYSTILGATICGNKCPAGYSSPPGSNSSVNCTLCSPEEYSVEGGQCTKCPNGTYLNGVGISQKNCTISAAGTYSNTLGATICENQCPASYSSPRGSTNSSNCTLCLQGEYSVKGGPCEKCPAGTYLNGVETSTDSCNKCPDGYSSLSGSINLNDCKESENNFSQNLKIGMWVIIFLGLKKGGEVVDVYIFVFVMCMNGM